MTANAHVRVCAYLLMSVLTDEDIDLIAARSRALGDGTRVRILSILSRGEQAVGHLAEAAGTPQSTVSKHLQVLFHAGLVQRRRDASTVIYSVASDSLLPWLRALATRPLPRSSGRMDFTHAGSEKKSAQRKRG
jgi:DNA-binding transcriptional ArsR family regulator